MTNSNHRLSIPEWYAGKNVFITGSTGFMGKVLVEKLLRDCSDLNRMYLLIRSKKGVDPAQRREEFINHIVFDNIRKKNPKVFDKIVVIKGDVTEADLGINDNERNELIKNVQVIFHCAANVRFDLTLKDAVTFNTLGTHKMLKLAEQIKDLKAFVHVSTAYCQCNEDVLEEKAYPAPHSPLGIAQMTDLLNGEILQLITPKLLNKLPNTYAYTKALTEDLVNTYREKFPIAIARPSIVISAFKEPYEGWVEGLNGPTGLIIGGGRGVIRSMHCNPDYNADIMPVDMTINAIIAVSWERAYNDSKEIYFCNVTESSDNPITWGEGLENGKKIFYDYPLCFSLWYPDGSIKSNYYYHLICVVLFHYLPAYFIDTLLFILRRKPFMIKVQRKVSLGLKLLQYYTTKVWTFKNDNLKSLMNKLNDDDREKFYFDIKVVNWDSFIKVYILGARLYLLKEKPETLPAARTLLKRLYILDRLVTLVFYGLILWMLWSYCDIISNTIEFTFEQTRRIFMRTPITRSLSS